MIGLGSAVASLLLASSAIASYGEVETYADHLAYMHYAKVADENPERVVAFIR